MAYVSLYEVLPELAMKETRTITVFPQYKRLPPGNYGLVEMYCADQDCDCRRVFLTVISDRLKKPVAVIAFGWESKDFYAKWFGADESSLFWDPNMLDELKGPCLNTCSPQSQYAQEVLRLVTRDALEDRVYVERLKRHYKAFKRKIEETPYEEDI